MTELTHAERDGFIDLPKDLEDELIKVGSTLPTWDVEGTFLPAFRVIRWV